MRFGIIFAALLMVALPVSAASVLTKPQDFTLTYGVYGGGFQALTADIRFQFTKTGYHMTMDAKPYGVLGHLLPWAGQYDTTGLLRNGEFIPQTHEKLSTWRDDKSHLMLFYNKNGEMIKQTKVTVEGGKKKSEAVTIDPSWHKGTVDIATAILNMLIEVNENGTCNQITATYDGKRRFDMRFTDKGSDTLAESNLNIARGKAHRCQLELLPIEGFTGKPRGYYMIQEQGRALGALPLVWMAPLWTGGPDVPVRMLIKSDFGSLFLHVQGIKKVE